MATAEQMRNSIEPGSIPQGGRQGLEQALGQIAPQQGMLPGPAQGQMMTESIGAPSNPLDPLVAGELDVNDDELTAGLSVGPGPGPEPEIPSDRVQRLRILAVSARSPVLREVARRSLRRLVGSDTLGR